MRALPLFAVTLWAAVGPLSLAGAQQSPPRARNVVVLYSDDAGWADFGFMPHAAADVVGRTPRIDQIAAEGARFMQSYMSGCVCSPSRAGLLTGRYQQRFGHETNIPPGYMEGGMDLGQQTIADHLGADAVGAATGLVGKWHLGYPPEYHPNERGFDWFYGLLQGSRSYRPIKNVSSHRVLQLNGESQPEVGYVTDRFGDAAVRFLVEQDRERPLFLFVSFTAPHGPLQPKASDVAELDSIENKKRRNYVGLVVGLDRAVGRVLDAIEATGRAEDTLVVFTNDNGGQTQVGANNGPLRGRKGQLFEGGVRVPMAMRWPGVIEPGTVVDEPVLSLDLLPTFVAAMGGTSTSEQESELDGIDLGPLLAGQEAEVPERTFYWRSLGSGGPVALRRGRWKLIVERGRVADAARNKLEEGDGDPEVVHLYDLQEDLGEQSDLSAEHADRVAELRADLTRWEGELEEPRWGIRRRRR